MRIEDSKLLKEFTKMTDDAWEKGWHERNGGNITYRIEDEFLNEICICFGGRAAEEIIFNFISTTPSSDLQNVNNIAQSMIKHYGMGTTLLVETYSNPLSQETIEKEIQALLSQEYIRTKELLTKHIDKLHKLAKALLEKETLYAQDIVKLKLV